MIRAHPSSIILEIASLAASASHAEPHCPHAADYLQWKSHSLRQGAWRLLLRISEDTRGLPLEGFNISLLPLLGSQLSCLLINGRGDCLTGP